MVRRLTCYVPECYVVVLECGGLGCFDFIHSVPAAFEDLVCNAGILFFLLQVSDHKSPKTVEGGGPRQVNPICPILSFPNLGPEFPL